MGLRFAKELNFAEALIAGDAKGLIEGMADALGGMGIGTDGKGDGAFDGPFENLRIGMGDIVTFDEAGSIDLEASIGGGDTIQGFLDDGFVLGRIEGIFESAVDADDIGMGEAVVETGFGTGGDRIEVGGHAVGIGALLAGSFEVILKARQHVVEGAEDKIERLGLEEVGHIGEPFRFGKDFGFDAVEYFDAPLAAVFGGIGDHLPVMRQLFAIHARTRLIKAIPCDRNMAGEGYGGQAEVGGGIDEEVGLSLGVAAQRRVHVAIKSDRWIGIVHRLELFREAEGNPNGKRRLRALPVTRAGG